MLHDTSTHPAFPDGHLIIVRLLEGSPLEKCRTNSLQILDKRPFFGPYLVIFKKRGDPYETIKSNQTHKLLKGPCR
jgi:hypothetical protein